MFLQREEQMRREMERHDRERRKEEDRLLRERQRENERLQREQRRENKRMEKFLQKQSVRVSCLVSVAYTIIRDTVIFSLHSVLCTPSQAEKLRQKEELRKEKEAARQKAANERATARRIAREYMELMEDERLELMELASRSKGLPSMLSLDSDTLQQLDSFRGMLRSKYASGSYARESHIIIFFSQENKPCLLFSLQKRANTFAD
jgi:predicted RNase H-related nuclease YkuK (DUF458 family)